MKRGSTTASNTTLPNNPFAFDLRCIGCKVIRGELAITRSAIICFLNCSVDVACGTEDQLVESDFALIGLVEVEVEQLEVPVEEIADRFELRGFSLDISCGAPLELNMIDR
jgi:hypothetical protein